MIGQTIVNIRNSLNKFFYKYLVKRIFFSMDPEVIHDRMIQTGKLLGKNFLGRAILQLSFFSKNNSLSQNLHGLKFNSPVGLAAGFDKNAELTQTLPSLGFGFAELGSVTGEPCEGNPKPRLWRLKKSDALIVYYGLKNDGAETIAKRLENKLPKIRKTKLGKDFVFGLSIAKTNCQETVECQKGIEDYYKAYHLLMDQADYITVNISCPNAFGGQPFTDKKSLSLLLTKLDPLYKKSRPVFIKLSPDLTKKELDDVLTVASEHHIDGFVCTNLTKNRNNPKIKEKDLPDVGGISGKVVSELSNDLISYVYQKTHGKKTIIGVGGVFSAEDAYKKIRLGANLIQLITGMIFEGPSLISEINSGLEKLLKKDGFENISEAVGIDSKPI